MKNDLPSARICNPRAISRCLHASGGGLLGIGCQMDAFFKVKRRDDGGALTGKLRK